MRNVHRRHGAAPDRRVLASTSNIKSKYSFVNYSVASTMHSTGNEVCIDND